jgi:hypothetical protein
MAVGAVTAARIARATTWESVSGGPVSPPERPTHTLTVLPAHAPVGAGTKPVRPVPSGAVQLARACGCAVPQQ